MTPRIDLTDASGQGFVLAVDSYQFPPVADLHDANWLVIRGEVRAQGRSWEFTEPGLLTWELGELAEALKAAARGSTGSLRTTEGVLGLDWTPDRLELRLGTSGLPEDTSGLDVREDADGRALRLAVVPTDLAGAARAARALTKAFPQRRGMTRW